MNPLALFLLILAVGFAAAAAIVGAVTGVALNIFWLLGLFAVIASLAIQIGWPTVFTSKEQQ